MPKTMCPLCGAKTHINTGDPAALEAKYPESGSWVSFVALVALVAIAMAR